MAAGGGRRRWAPARAASIALPLLILLATGIATWQLDRIQDSRERARLDVQARAVASTIRQRLVAFADVLYGVRGLFGASAQVGVREFHDHIEAVDLARRYPGIRVVGVAELVPRADLDAFARRVRARTRTSGLPYPAFRVRGHGDGDRALVVDYIEPQRGNEPAFGLDLLADARRRAGAERALATGRPIATAPLALAQDPQRATSAVVFLPLGGARPGVAYVGFRIRDLFRANVPTADYADLELADIGPTDDAPPSEPRRRAEVFRHGRRDGRRVATLRFDDLGRRWELAVAPRESVLSTTERAVPWVVLVAGAALALLAGWLLTASRRTERRAVALAERMTADLTSAQADLERSNQELQRFAYVASHDLREPLRSITGFIGLLERRAGPGLDADARSWIGYALQGAERMNALISDLLEYSRAGRDADPHATADLQRAWDAAVVNLRAAIEESGATVTADPLPIVAGRQREMNQVMQNLLGNAIKYRGDRAPVVHAGARRGDGRWAVSVSDNGIGIDPEHRERIFVLFQRLHTRDDYEGTGMGLSIVKKIVEAQGGSVGVESTPGEGSRFTVVLPAPPEGLA